MNGLKPVVHGGVLIVGIATFSGCKETPEARIAELRAMARRPGAAEVRRLEGALSDGNQDVRATALSLMTEIDPDRATAAARRALDDGDGVVRATAVRVLGPHLDEDLIARFTSLGSADPVWQVRSAALAALARTEGEPVRAVFEQGLGDGNREVRRAALSAGSSRQGLLSTPAVAQVLAKDEDWENRVLAAEILGGSADPEAYAPLDEAALDPHEFVRAAAVRARQALVRSGAARPAPPPASPPPETTKRPPGV
jgi:HEAT repeat protein